MNSSLTEKKKQMNPPDAGGDTENESEKGTGALFSF